MPSSSEEIHSQQSFVASLSGSLTPPLEALGGGEYSTDTSASETSQTVAPPNPGRKRRASSRGFSSKGSKDRVQEAQESHTQDIC